MVRAGELTRHLVGVDSRWAGVVEAVGPFRIARPQRTDFQALARSIVFQQLAGKAAASIYGKLERAFGGSLDPASVARARMPKLRGAGLSEAKATTVRGLARAVDSGELDLPRLRRAPDEEVERALCGLRGIGPWTAHMYLVFHLRRPDVWPTGDYGVRQGFRAIFGLGELPSPRRLYEMGEPYRPYRTTVAWYCWRILDVRPPSEAPVS